MKVGSASFAPSQSQQKYIILPRNVKKQPPPPPPSPPQQQKTHEDREEERQHGNRNTFHLPKSGLSRFPSCLLVAPKAGCSMENHGMTFRPCNWRATTTNAIDLNRLSKAHIQKTSTSHIHGPKHVIIYIYTHASIMYTCYTWWSSKTYSILQTMFCFVEWMRTP